MKILMILVLIVLKQKLNRHSEDQKALCEVSAESFAHSFLKYNTIKWENKK